MRVAVVGANGQLGRELLRAFAEHDTRPVTRADCDVADGDGLRRVLADLRPDLVVNAAAYTDVNGAELHADQAFRVNEAGARNVAAAAAGAGVVYVSTDYVFDGAGGAPYVEDGPTNPINVYGRSKRAGELATVAANPRAWIVRTSWIYGGPGKTFVNAIFAAARSRGELTVVYDEVAGPTLASDLADGILRLVERGAPGVYHLANAGECSRAELARAALELTGSSTRVRPVSSADYWRDTPNVAPRPAHSTLANRAAAALGVTLRPWRDALADHLCARS